MPSICTALTGSTPVTLADVQRQLLDGDTLLLELEGKIENIVPNSIEYPNDFRR